MEEETSFYSFAILQDDLTSPYILASPGQTDKMRPISPSLESPSSADWISGFYKITAQIRDTAGGAGAYNEASRDFSSNIISWIDPVLGPVGRGTDSGVYTNDVRRCLYS